MMKWMIYLLVSVGSLMGCMSREHRLLRQADQLIDGGHADSAAVLLATIVANQISSDEDRAYYELLRVAANMERKHSWGRGELVGKWSIDLKDDRLQALAYHYDAVYARHQGEVRRVFRCENTAESYAQETDDRRLNYRIQETMSGCHYDNGNWKQSLEYDRNRLNDALQEENQQWMAHTMCSMAANFAMMQQVDSARSYLSKVIPVMAMMDREHQALMWQTQGQLSLNHPKQAEQYFLKALKCYERVDTRMLLADLYAKQGQYDLAEREWKKVERYASMVQRSHILKARYGHAVQENDTASARKWADDIIALQDSLSEKYQRYVAKMEDQCAEAEEDGMNTYIELWRFQRLVGCVFLIILCLVAFGYAYHRWAKNRLEKINKRVDSLKEAECKAKRETNRLARNMTELRRHHGKRMTEGRRCYEHIKRGDTVVKWQKKEFECFMEYYRTQDPDFVLHLETHFERLTAKQQFFETLYHMGYDDQHVAETMGITDSTIRATKSRIRSRKVENMA